MNDDPETRESLLLRLSDESDAAAWDEFVSIYQPMIHRLAVRRGLQPNDADDVTQQVLMSVARVVEGWQRDAQRGGFRSWLHVVARHAIINFWNRGPKDLALGGTGFLMVCGEIEGREVETDRIVEEEFARTRLRRASRIVKAKVKADSWKAFWLTAVEGKSPEDVARQLDVPVGRIYGARSRIMKLLRETLETMVAEQSEQQR